MSKQDELRTLIEKSKGTDVPLLLQAKEVAKRRLNDDPSAGNLKAFSDASRLLESAMEQNNAFKNVKDVLAHLKEEGRKIGQSKLYKDIDEARLPKQADGSFKRKDVERYAKSLPLMGTGDKAAEAAAQRQEEKELQEIRRIKASADKEEFLLAVKKCDYIPRAEIYEIFGARAVALSSMLKTHFESNALDIIEKMEGNPKKTPVFLDAVGAAMDEAFNEYVSTQDFEVLFKAETNGNEDENEVSSDE